MESPVKMKKRPTNDDSDEFDVDEPEEFEESGSDWDPEEEEGNSKKRKGRGRPGKKVTEPKRKKLEKPPSDDDDDEEDNEDDEEGEGEEEEEDDSDDEHAEPRQAGANGTTTPNISIKAFTNGSFVVLKSDFRSKKNPPLWRIDGKALLQKYVPFEQDGDTLYKNTSTYSGWTPSNQDQYIPAPVTYVHQGKKEIIIEFNREKVTLDEEGGGKSEGSAGSNCKTAEKVTTQTK